MLIFAANIIRLQKRLTNADWREMKIMKTENFICEGIIYTSDGDEIEVRMNADAVSRSEAIAMFTITRDDGYARDFSIDSEIIEGSLVADLRKTRKMYLNK